MKRDCECKRARHQHGTRQAYISDGCRCPPCTTAHTAAKNRRVRLVAYGQLPPKSIPVLPTRLRVAALMTQGWPVNTLSRMCGWNPNRIHIYMNDDGGISPANAQKIADLYDQLWDKKPPRRTRHEKSIYARTVNFAKARGYLAPLMLDDDAIDRGHEITNPVRDDLETLTQPEITADHRGFIDEIAVERAMHGERINLTRAELSDAIDKLTGMGTSAELIADRLGVTERLVQRYRAKGRAA